MSPWKKIAVTGPDDLIRIDIWLSRAGLGLSRNRAKQMLMTGEITLNGKQTAKSAIVTQGDIVEIWKEPPCRDFTPLPDLSLMIEVLHEEAEFAVIKKPSGIPSVPLTGDETGTLANGVVALFPECRTVGRRPGDGGLLQRLDTETSGIVLVARTQSKHDCLFEQQRQGRIEKTYLALTARSSSDPPKQIDAPLSSAGPGNHMMRVSEKGRPASTQIEIVERCAKWLLVKARISHGVRHQIRAHLASAACPIAGDTLYGTSTRPPGLNRLFLHCHQIAFSPKPNEEIRRFQSQLPTDLANFLKEKFPIGSLFI